MKWLDLACNDRNYAVALACEACQRANQQLHMKLRPLSATEFAGAQPKGSEQLELMQEGFDGTA